MQGNGNSGSRPRMTIGKLVGAAPSMQRVYSLMQRVSAYRYSVLIVGEPGTGKELVARSIHSLAARKDKPFVHVDCSTLAPAVVDSELFGFAQGAPGRRPTTGQGWLASAKDGTLFLEEVGGLSLEYQAALQRVLEENKFRPAGSADATPFLSRIIATSSQDLESRVKAGTFRQDFCMMLNMMQIKLPALRERKGDIPLLADALIQKYNTPESQLEFPADAMEQMLAYDWPGNVREFEYVVHNAVSVASDSIIRVEDLGLGLPSVQPDGSLSRKMPWRDAESEIRAAASMLGIGESTVAANLKFQHLQA